MGSYEMGRHEYSIIITKLVSVVVFVVVVVVVVFVFFSLFFPRRGTVSTS